MYSVLVSSLVHLSHYGDRDRLQLFAVLHHTSDNIDCLGVFFFLAFSTSFANHDDIWYVIYLGKEEHIKL